MRRQLEPALRMLAILTVVLGLVYPLALTGVAHVLFPQQADGSLLERDGVVVGSSLMGQAFSTPQYFHPRPSAAGPLASGSPGDDVDSDDLSQATSGASNQGPNNPDLLAAIRERAAAYREINGLGDGVAIPIDAVTASGSGVDPHISPANARLQADRVAAARHVPVGVVLDLIAEHTDRRSLGFLGEAGVNVLELNLALDELSP